MCSICKPWGHPPLHDRLLTPGRKVSIYLDMGKAMIQQRYWVAIRGWVAKIVALRLTRGIQPKLPNYKFSQPFDSKKAANEHLKYLEDVHGYNDKENEDGLTTASKQYTN